MCVYLLCSAFYMSPEMLDRNYDRGADVWATGVIMFSMLFGYLPFYCDDDPDDMDEVYRQVISLAILHGYMFIISFRKTTNWCSIRFKRVL